MLIVQNLIFLSRKVSFEKSQAPENIKILQIYLIVENEI